MRILPVRVAGPDGQAVTTELAKTHLRVDGPDEDILIASLIAAATEHLDGYHGILGRCIAPQSWRQDYAGFEADMVLNVSPVLKIESVQYVDPSGVIRDLEGARLFAAAGRTIVRPPAGQTWPDVAQQEDAVQITVRAGYAVVPTPIKQAILLLVGHWYANREAVVTGATLATLPLAVDRLLAPYRRPPV